MQWWSDIQPEWRDTESWPFLKEDAAGEDWGHLLDGGKDGLFLVVVSLGWWINARVPSEESKANDAVADVTWVINNLVSHLSADATSVDSSPPATPSPAPRLKRAKMTRIGRPPKRLRL